MALQHALDLLDGDLPEVNAGNLMEWINGPLMAALAEDANPTEVTHLEFWEDPSGFRLAGEAQLLPLWGEEWQPKEFRFQYFSVPTVKDLLTYFIYDADMVIASVWQ